MQNRARPLSRSRLCRLLGSGLAVTGLLGHGIAMLLVAVLAAAEAAPPAFGEICTPDGLVTASSLPVGDEDTPSQSGGQIDSCPVCTAYAQSASGTLPAIVVLPWTVAALATPAPVHDDRPQAAGRLAPPSRGPPVAA